MRPAPRPRGAAIAADGITADGGETRLAVYPGLAELQSGSERARVAFGLLDASGEGRRLWSVLPIRITLQSGDQALQIGLNGLDFLTRTGVHIGRELRLRGVSRGDVLSLGGDVEVSGRVEGSVWTFGSDVRLLAGSVVRGDVAALGGTVRAEPGAVVAGESRSLPAFRIPYLGWLTSPHAADVLRLLVEAFGLVLFLFLLFLLIQLGRPLLTRLLGALASGWRESVLMLALAVVLVPLLVAFLVLTVAGILVVPFLLVLLLVLGYAGYLALATRLGMWIRGGADDSPFALYVSGLLGVLVLKGPVLVGLLLALLATGGLAGLGRFLASLSTAIAAAAGLYGLGGALSWLRHRSA